MKHPTILVYTSSADWIPHREGGGHKTGTWLSEIADTLPPLFEAGAEFIFTTPDGQPCVIDDVSKKLRHANFSRRRRQKQLAFIETLRAHGFATPCNIKDILSDATRLDSIDALFMPGGHAPMTDVLHTDWRESDEYNPDTGTLLEYFHTSGKPTGAICHAPANFGAAPYIDGTWLYEGYQFTCVSMLAEWLTEDLPFFGQSGHLKDYPKHILERHGGSVQNSSLLTSLVVEDREVLTGQDPYSGEEFGEKFKHKVMTWINAQR